MGEELQRLISVTEKASAALKDMQDTLISLKRLVAHQHKEEQGAIEEIVRTHHH